MEVLKGASECIKKYRPILYIEVDDTNLKEQGSCARELISYITTFDYLITDSVNKKTIDQSFDFEHAHFDIICNK